MTDVVITAANVVKGAGAKTRTGIAGATITAGQVVYSDASDSNKLKLADSDGATALRTPVGIALHGAASGQPLTYQYEGLLTIGGTVAAGIIYVCSDTPGGLMPSDDLETGDYTTVMAIGQSTSVIKVQIVEGGVAV